MTIQEFRDYMASGKPVVGGGEVHMMFHQLSHGGHACLHGTTDVPNQHLYVR